MPRWQQVEAFVDNHVGAGRSFTSRQYASTEGLSWPEASEHVQAYLTAQRSPKSRTKYVLKRQPGTRTSSSHWTVGEKATDVRRRGLTFSSDVKAKAKGAFEPDLRRMAAINPGAARRAERVIDATLDGAMKVLEAAVRT